MYCKVAGGRGGFATDASPNFFLFSSALAATVKFDKKKNLHRRGFFWNVHTDSVSVRRGEEIYCLSADVIPNAVCETVRGRGLAAAQNGCGAPGAAALYGEESQQIEKVALSN